MCCRRIGWRGNMRRCRSVAAGVLLYVRCDYYVDDAAVYAPKRADLLASCRLPQTFQVSGFPLAKCASKGPNVRVVSTHQPQELRAALANMGQQWVSSRFLNAPSSLTQAAAPPAATLLTFPLAFFRHRWAQPGPAGVLEGGQQELGRGVVEDCPNSQAGAQPNIWKCCWTPHDSRCGPGALNGVGGGGQDSSSGSKSSPVCWWGVLPC